MRKTKKIKVPRLFIVVLLLAMLVVSSCKPKATHLTQNLENSKVPGQSLTQTTGVFTSTPGQEITPVQSPTSVNDPTTTLVNPQTTQAPSETLALVQTTTSSPVVLIPTATTKSSTSQAATSTLAPTQTRTLTLTQTRTLTPTQTRTPTLQTGWAGEWVFFVGEGDGPYKSADGYITLDDLLAEGSFTLDGVAFSFIASLSEDQSNLNGRYQWGATEGWLNWVMDSNYVQFRGTLDNVYAFCAARDGMSMPAPCGDYVPY